MGKFKVYVTDCDYGSLDNEIRVLAGIDTEPVLLDCKTDEELIERASDADALIVEYKKITDKVFDNLKNLKIVVRYGVGYDCVDVESATRHGVCVCNVPDYGIEEVSTHAMALILALVRKIVLTTNNVKAGIWDATPSKPLYRTVGKVLGLAGFGRIPRLVAKKAKAFGFDIIAFDPYASDEVFNEYGVTKVDFDTLLKRSDIVSVHTPLTKDTFHLFSDETFSSMKKGALLVNTARGAVVDEKALVHALNEKIISGAALDVCEKEPIDKDNVLLSYDNVIITPHVAFYSEESQVSLQTKAAEEVVRVLLGEKPLNPVNKVK